MKINFKEYFRGIRHELSVLTGGHFVMLTVLAGVVGVSFGRLAELLGFSYPELIVAPAGGITAASYYLILRKVKMRHHKRR